MSDNDDNERPDTHFASWKDSTKRRTSLGRSDSTENVEVSFGPESTGTARCVGIRSEGLSILTDHRLMRRSRVGIRLRLPFGFDSYQIIAECSVASSINHHGKYLNVVGFVHLEREDREALEEFLKLVGAPGAVTSAL